MKKENEMNCMKREYLNEIKLLFPTMHKNEKRYLQGLSKNIDEYLNNNDDPDKLSTKETFYSFFGSPTDVVHQYFSGMDTESFCSYLKLRKLKRCVLLTLCTLILASTIIIDILLWQEHLSVMRSEIVSVDTVIIEYEE